MTESIRRRLDPALEEVIDSVHDTVTPPLSSSTTIVNNASFDSLDHVLQDMEVLQQMIPVLPSPTPTKVIPTPRVNTPQVQQLMKRTTLMQPPPLLVRARYDHNRTY